MIDEILSYLSSLLTWLVNWLQSSLGNLNVLGLQFNAVPITILVIGSVVVGYLSWVLLKNASLSLVVMGTLLIVWWLLKDLGNIPLGYGFSGLDLAVVAIVVLAVWAYGKLKNKPS